MGIAALAESLAQLTRVRLAQVRVDALRCAGKMLLFALMILGPSLLVSYYLEK